MNQLPTRRRFLRGLGTMVALPFMESLVPASVAKAAAAQGAKGQHPLRMAFIYSPNGKNMAHWTPGRTGTDFELPASLKPLEKHRQDLLVMSGLMHEKAAANGDGPGDHARANATFLTGCQARKTAGADIRVGVSVDQIAANAVGQLTHLPSLELSCDEPRRAGNCDSGYSCAYQFNLAWKTESNPISPERDPRLAFERLFTDSAAGGEDKARRDAYNKSVLDFVLEDARAVQKELGRTDRHKLDEYMSSIRDVERRITTAGKEARKLPDYKSPTGIPQSYEEHIRVMFDLIWLAFQTDTTRVASFLLAHDGSNRAFPEIGVPDAHHGISHHQNNPEKLAKIARIDEYYSRQLAYFLERMKSTREGDGTLLDNSMIVFGSGIGDPDRHNHDDLPVLFAGGGGGTIKTGRHISVDRVPMCNLYLSMLDRMGVKEDRFGDSTGRLNQLA